MSYGTVKFWQFVTENTNGDVKQETFRTWEEATDAFRDTATADPIAAVYAVQTNGWWIKTWARGGA